MASPRTCPAPKRSRTCPECGKAFTPQRSSAVYCSRSCKTDAANLEATRGKQLYRLAYHWRGGNGVKFSELSFLVDQFRREDRESGRPAPMLERGDCHTTATAYFTNEHRRRKETKS